MLLTPDNLQALWVTFKVAALTTLILLLAGTPLAWWLARSRAWVTRPIGALVALPLVLPPSVLGFYLLVALGPEGPLGRWMLALGLPVGVKDLKPPVIQELSDSLVERRWIDAGPDGLAGKRVLDTFFSVVLPLCRPGLVTGCIMSFAHTVGEFGVVLMVGGNIPGVTRVVSVQIFDHVEALEYADAHRLAAVMLAFSFSVLLALQVYSSRQARKGRA